MKLLRVISISLPMGLFPLFVNAQTTITENFTGTTTNNNWYIYGPARAGSSTTVGTGSGGGGACLTASSIVNSLVGGITGRVPGCFGNPYYSTTTLVGGYNTTNNLANAPDPVGSGALRLTNGARGNTDYGQNEAGAIVLATPYRTSSGLNINFTSVTYGGDGGNGTGADGMSFFMSDASVPFTLGSFGGSLGYACSQNSNNRPYFGVSKGFISVGIDEYGNNQIAGTQTGVSQFDSSGNPIYTAFTPNSITVRGPGDVTNASLLAAGLSTAQILASNYAAVANTCSNGYLSDANDNAITSNGNIARNAASRVPIAAYPILQTTQVVKPGTNIINPIYSQQNSNSPARVNASPITYNLNITAPTNAGTTTIPPILNFSYSYNGGIPQKVVVNQALNNMPTNLNMGFAASTGGSSNIHEITCFSVAPNTLSGSSTSGNVQQDSRVRGGTQIFVGSYNQNSWAGSLKAISLIENQTTGVISISSNVNWDAQCVLTGGACASTGGTGTAQAPASRNILTSNGRGSANTGGGPGSSSASRAGVPFRWASLTSTQKAALDPGNSTSTSNVLNFYRGDNTYAAFPIGSLTDANDIYRARSGILGDIINSSPVWVGPPVAPYSVFNDKLTGATGAESSYTTFATGPASSRANVVYVGANDGMLHGFRAGVYSNGVPTLTAANNDGLEVLAYVPNLALSTLSSTAPTLNYAMPNYSHNAFVDATPGVGDLFYNGAWHTWLVGGLGAGGNATGEVGDAEAGSTNPIGAAGSIYALDITTPATPSSQNETTAALNVVGDWQTVPSFTANSGTPGTGVTNLTCVRSTGSRSCGLHLGSTYGSPIIRRLHNGSWGVIFGNGLDSPLGTAGIFIMSVDINSGAISFYYLDTGVGRTTASKVVTTATGVSTTVTGLNENNGIVNVASADLDGDHITDYVYAGDALGNLWRFDLTSSNPNNWAASSRPLYTVPASGNLLRPITTSPVVTQATVTTASGTKPYLLIDFATGRKFPQTASGAATYASGTQGIYGIWDWDMAAWNSMAANTNKQFASRTSAPTANLVTQTLTATSTTVSGVSGVSVYRGTSVPVCWSGSTACTGGASSNQHTGWYVPFPTDGEQAIYNPTTLNSAFLINTVVPASSNPFNCSSVAATGYTIAVDLLSGGSTSLFNVPTGSNVNNPMAVGPYVGLGLGGVGTNYVLRSFNDMTTIISTLLNGGAVATNLGATPATSSPGARITWVELR